MPRMQENENRRPCDPGHAVGQDDADKGLQAGKSEDVGALQESPVDFFKGRFHGLDRIGKAAQNGGEDDSGEGEDQRPARQTLPEPPDGRPGTHGQKEVESEDRRRQGDGEVEEGFDKRLPAEISIRQAVRQRRRQNDQDGGGAEGQLKR